MVELKISFCTVKKLVDLLIFLLFVQVSCTPFFKVYFTSKTLYAKTFTQKICLSKIYLNNFTKYVSKFFLTLKTVCKNFFLKKCLNKF